jgi:Ulp1 family protease
MSLVNSARKLFAYPKKNSYYATEYIPYTRSLFVRVAELDKGFRGKTASVQVPQQTNYNDCGLFALAFVLAIANKKDPA